MPTDNPGPREIFSFEYEGKARYIDPSVAEESYWSVLDDLDDKAFAEQLESPIREVRRRAELNMLQAIYKAFGVKALDPETGTGLTEQETLDLSQRFWEWRESVKKNGDDTPAESPPSADASAMNMGDTSRTTEKT